MSAVATSTGSERSLVRALTRAFPVPALLAPAAAGIDISDASIKWLVFSGASRGLRVDAYGEEPLAPGAVVNGIIKDPSALTAALLSIKQKMHGITYAHAALPEESAYIFQMRVPSGTPREQVLRLIEFEFEGRVPIPPQAAVYDFDVIEQAGVEEEIGVVVFPRELADAYADAFSAAGISLLSLEAEPRSVARAVCTGAQHVVSLLVDFGRARSGFAVLKNGIPIFSSTVDVGGDSVDNALKKVMHLGKDEFIQFKNEQGLKVEGPNRTQVMEALTGTVSALADEITRHYHYWDTRRDEHGDRMTPVSQVVLVGGSANLHGLTDYVAGRVQAPTNLGNVWSRVGGPNEFTPPIDRRTSLQYATAIGLALRAFV